MSPPKTTVSDKFSMTCGAYGRSAYSHNEAAKKEYEDMLDWTSGWSVERPPRKQLASLANTESQVVRLSKYKGVWEKKAKYQRTMISSAAFPLLSNTTDHVFFIVVPGSGFDSSRRKLATIEWY